MSLYAEYMKRFPDLVACLERARAAGRFAHSFLIASPDEKVRREFSLVLAQIAGCLSGKAGRPDLSCRYCRQIEEKSYPDMHWLVPEGKMYLIKVGSRENPEPNTLRDLLDHLGYTSGSHRKIGIVEDADRMNDEAQNALLKTLEEPPPDTTLILTTGNPASLLPTTRSRCQILSLPGNSCSFDFPGSQTVKESLADLCFSCANDLVRTEAAVEKLLSVMSSMEENAAAAAQERYADELSAARQSDDPAYVKRLEARVADAASGAYIRDRGKFLAEIYTFCSQIFLLSRHLAPVDLPNPELLEGILLPASLPEERADRILKEAEELLFTCRFNVNAELALRTFGINLTMN